MSSYHIDEVDQKILSYLVKNARMPFLVSYQFVIEKDA